MSKRRIHLDIRSLDVAGAAYVDRHELEREIAEELSRLMADGPGGDKAAEAEPSLATRIANSVYQQLSEGQKREGER